MQKIGLEAILNMSSFKKGMKDFTGGIDTMVDKSGKGSNALTKMGNILGGLAKVGVGAAIAGIGTLTGVILGSIKAAAEAQQVEAQLDAVLKSTGGTAGMTKDEILKLADALSQVTPFEDELIISAETMLLQFKNIGEEVFPQATEMALDLAQRLGIDAASAAKLLGKALEEPGEGLLRLKQAGVAFTDEQEKVIAAMVEAGDAAGAQKYIMDQLALSVGGSARAAGETFAGQMEIVKNKIGNVAEAIGLAFLPLVTKMVEKFSQFVTEHGPQIAAMFQKIAEWIGTTIPAAIQTLSGFWTNTLLPAFTAVYDYIVTNIVPGFENAKTAIQNVTNDAIVPMSLKVGELTSPMFTGLWDVLTKKVGPALSEFFGWNKNVSLSLGEWLVPALNETWTWMNNLWNKIKKDLGPTLQWLDKNILTPVKETFDKVGEAIQAVIAWVEKLIAALDFDLPDWLTPGSPTPFELGLRGIADAMRQVARDGMPALTFGMGALTGTPGAGASTSTTTSFGGDTYYVSVQDRLAAAVLISAARDRQLRRLAVGMGG